MSVRKMALAAVMALSLAGCAGGSDQFGPGPKEKTGTLLGGLAGAAIGSRFGGGLSGHVAGAVAGAAIGGLIGNRIGAALDEEDKRQAYVAQLDALNEGAAGAPVSWRNPDSGHYGTVVPGPYYASGGRRCRSYTHTVYINGLPRTVRRTACRNSDGTWTPLG